MSRAKLGRSFSPLAFLFPERPIPRLQHSGAGLNQLPGLRHKQGAADQGPFSRRPSRHSPGLSSLAPPTIGFELFSGCSRESSPILLVPSPARIPLVVDVRVTAFLPHDWLNIRVTGSPRVGAGAGRREVGVRESGLGEGFRPVLPSGCGGTSAGLHRLRDAEEEEEQRLEESVEGVGPGERDARRCGWVVNAEECPGSCRVCRRQEVVA